MCQSCWPPRHLQPTPLGSPMPSAPPDPYVAAAVHWATAEVDPAALVEAKRWVDAVGHYSRPDVFRLHWDRSPKPPIVRE